MKSLLVALLIALASAFMGEFITNVSDITSPVIATLPVLQHAYELVAGVIG